MKISIVTTMYKSDDFLNEFHRRVSKVAIQITPDYEIIFINDGCPQNSLLIAKCIADNDSHVKVVNLSRNFGHHKAMMTGLGRASGDYIFLLDCDLEEQPEDLLVFYKKMQDTNCDVVISQLIKRKGGFCEKYIDGLFYTLFNFLSESKIPKNTSTMTLMNKRFKEDLVKYQEKNIYFHGVRSLIGFHQEIVYIDKIKRFGVRTYTTSKKLALLVNSVTSFSAKPLYYISYLGAFIFCISFLFIAKLVFDKIFFSVPIEGWTSVMVSIWFIGGIILLSLGVVAIYLAKIFTEVKDRPYSTISEVYPGK